MLRRNDARVQRLRQVPLFAALHDRDLSRVARLTYLTDFQRGTVLARQGAVGAEVFVVVAGEVAVERDGRTLARLGAGEVVGELALVDGGHRSASVIAASDVEVLVLSGPEFRALLDDVPTVRRRIMSALAGRLRTMDGALTGPAATSPAGASPVT